VVTLVPSCARRTACEGTRPPRAPRVGLGLPLDGIHRGPSDCLDNTRSADRRQSIYTLGALAVPRSDGFVAEKVHRGVPGQWGRKCARQGFISGPGMRAPPRRGRSHAQFPICRLTPRASPVARAVAGTGRSPRIGGTADTAGRSEETPVPGCASRRSMSVGDRTGPLQ
jgi:hypothetical protein